jgi:hypothetical protein
MAPEILHGALVVEDAERRARLPVRDPLVVGERVGQERPTVTTGLSASLGPSGASGCGRLGMSSSSRAARRHRLVLGGQRLLLGAEGRGSRPGALGGGDLAATRSRPTSLEIVVDARTDGVALGR